jgi:hypothetical protein
MYTIVAEALVDKVEIDSLSASARRKLEDAKRALQAEGRPAFYGCKKQRDGSFQIVIPVGMRRMLLDYDIDEKQHHVVLRYLKWDWFREAIDWTIDLLGNVPGGKK